MADVTSTLILTLKDQVTAAARSAADSLTGVRKSVKDFQSEFAKSQKELVAAGKGLLAAGAGAYAFARGLNSIVGKAREFESAMADVRKVVSFDTAEQFREMGDAIIQMSKALPMSAKGIADIVAAAGQAGIAREELLGFAEAATKIAVAFDMTAEEAGESLAKIKTQLGASTPQVVELSDAINELSNSSASSAADIVEFMKRAAGMGKLYGFTAEQTAALGSAFISSGVEANVAATSFRAMGRALVAGSNATTAQKKALSTLGLNSREVAMAMQEDATKTFSVVMERLSKLPEYMQASVAEQLFGSEARALLPLIQNYKVLEQSLKAVEDRAGYIGSAFREFDVRAQTSANAAQLFQNNIDALQIVIGDALLPAINDLMARLVPLIEAFADFAKENPEVVQAVVAIAGALVALTVAAAGVRFAFALLKTGFVVITGTAKVLAAIIGGVAGTMMGIAAAGALLVAAIVDQWADIKKAITEFDLLGVLYNIGEGIQNVVKGLTGIDLNATVGEVVRTIIDFFAALPMKMLRIGGEMMDALLDGMAAKLGQIGDFFGDIGSWVNNLLVDATGIGTTRGFKTETFGGRKGTATWGTGLKGPGGSVPGRALGGPVTSGKPYWILERGEPEIFMPDGHGAPVLFTPKQSGAIHPLSRFPDAIFGALGRSGGGMSGGWSAGGPDEGGRSMWGPGGGGGGVGGPGGAGGGGGGIGGYGGGASAAYGDDGYRPPSGGGGGSWDIDMSRNPERTARTGPAKGDMSVIAPMIMADLMHDFGLTREQAAGIVGNLAHESGRFKHMQEVGRPNGRGGWGWAQWTNPGRRTAFFAFAKKHGLDPSSYEANYRFMTEGEPHEWDKALKRVKRTGNLYDAMYAFEDEYERAGVPAYPSRYKLSQQVMGMPAVDPAVPKKAPPPSAPKAQAAGGGTRKVPQPHERYEASTIMSQHPQPYAMPITQSHTFNINGGDPKMVEAAIVRANRRSLAETQAAMRGSYADGIETR